MMRNVSWVYNAAYDRRLIRQSLDCHETALAEAEQLSFGCIMELYARFYGQYSEYHGSYRWQKLVNAVNQCSLQMEGPSHRALADTRASLAVLKYMASMAVCVHVGDSLPSRWCVWSLAPTPGNGWPHRICPPPCTDAARRHSGAIPQAVGHQPPSWASPIPRP